MSIEVKKIESGINLTNLEQYPKLHDAYLRGDIALASSYEYNNLMSFIKSKMLSMNNHQMVDRLNNLDAYSVDNIDITKEELPSEHLKALVLFEYKRFRSLIQFLESNYNLKNELEAYRFMVLPTGIPKNK